MCEIYGFSGKREKELNNDLREFYSHACRHPNGWGLALLDQRVPEITREVCRADRSVLLSERLSVSVTAKTALAHIRLATVGNEDYDNCHPFTAVDQSGRSWTLIHNGTIFESDKLNRYVFRQKGETDSERILLYILDKNKGVRGEEARFRVIDSVAVKLSDKNKLNFMAFDGQDLYVHKNEAGTMFRRVCDGYVLIATKPLDDGVWEEVPLNRLQVYRDGRLIWEGTQHEHTYIHDEEQMNMLYLGYSGL